MGMSRGMQCEDCDERFSWSSGGGFTFSMLHCDQCGAERAQSFDEFGSRPDVPDASDAPVEIELACECGGTFTHGVPPICPSCRSHNIGDDPHGFVVLYD